MPPKFKIAGAIECERMKIVGQSTGLPIETQSEILEWSDSTQLFVRASKVGDFAELIIPADRPGAEEDRPLCDQEL